MTSHIVERNALPTLIQMLQSEDAVVQYEAVGVIGNLVHTSPNIKKEVLLAGALQPVIRLLSSCCSKSQTKAVFLLGEFVATDSDCKDNVSDLVMVGGVQRLHDGEFIVQATKDCVAKMLKRLEEKIHGHVLNHLLYLMQVSEEGSQRQVALALAHLCSADDQRRIFIDNHGLELLIGLLGSSSPKPQLDGAMALCKLANKASTRSPVDAVPPSPTPQVYLGEQYVNNATLSSVTFLVEGKRFYANRICLLACSDAFCAMFDGSYREKEARDIVIPNIRWEVFELMMRFIYTGSVDVTPDVAQDLLRAADQYLIEGLKRLCEHTIAQDISLENVSNMYELSEAFNAISLRHACIRFILEQYDKLSGRPGHSLLIQRIIPEIRNYFIEALTKANSHDRL